MVKEDIGLILLGVTGAFGVWSAMNTSPLGTVAFAGDNLDVAYTSMIVGTGVIVAMASGIALLYGEKGYAASIATGVTGIGLFIWYDHLIKSTFPAQELVPMEGEFIIKEEEVAQ